MLGQVIHGYRVDRALSEDKGGFGDVYFATHVDSGAEAVVKVLKPEMSAQRDIVARFFNEARAAASVHHPGVVQIHNVGYHGDRAYLLMERLHGSDLETRLAGGPLPIDRAIVFMRQAAGAVGAAHDRGIVHRDLKPANLFVVADPDVVGGERVKVLDFGIAKLTADAGAGKTQGVFGTPAYMSPEQCASTGAVDGRADLYSLGCIFYELVCGRPPFGQGGLELIAAHLRDTPPPPRAIAPWLPPAVEQVILALLEKQPDRRIPSCAALIAALDNAALASGLAGASAAHLASASMPYAVPAGSGASAAHLAVAGASASMPYAVPTASGVMHATTLGSAAAASTVPPARRGKGVWLGIGAIVVVAGAVAVILAMPRHRPTDDGLGSGSSGSGSGSIAAAAGSADAGAAAAPPDATRIAAVVPDAAPPADASAGVADDSQAIQLAEQGKQAMYAGEYSKAQKLFQEAATHSADPRYLIDLAVADIQLGEFEPALSVLRAASQQSPTDDQARKIQKLRELIARETKRQGSAEPSTEPPKPDADPADADPAARAEKLNASGKSEALAGRHAAALGLFQQAYELAPQAKILLNIGIMQFQLGRCADARRTLQRIAPTWPSDPAVSKATELLSRLGDCRPRTKD